MFVALALPLIEVAWPLPDAKVPRQRARIAAAPGLVVVLTTALLAAGLVANREGATDARQEAIEYSVDADTKAAHWASDVVPASEWNRSLLSEPALPLEDAIPWSADSALWNGPAPAAELSAPAVTVLRRHTRRCSRADAPAVVPPRSRDAGDVGRRRSVRMHCSATSTSWASSRRSSASLRRRRR